MTTTKQIAAAMEAMDDEQWPSAISLLIGVLSATEVPDFRLESTVRILLAQSLHSSGEQERALVQARQALSVSEQTDDRGLIWKCMALIASMEIIKGEKL